MRKKINILFVLLAFTSVAYGMVLRYSPQPEAVLSIQDEAVPRQVTFPQDDLTRYEDGVVNLDALVADPD
jgi:hypothetical protein